MGRMTRSWHRYCTDHCYAGDVGDYGLGYCTTSLELCADCTGDVTYFDVVLAGSKGEPYTVPKAVCMHEEDGGVLWKHVEYRSPAMAETRRARNLVLQSSYTVVNYGMNLRVQLFCTSQ